MGARYRLGLMTTGQGYKGDGQQLTGMDFTCSVLAHQQQLLGHEAAADRNDHAPTGFELGDQRRWNMAGSGSNHNGVEGCVFLPAVITVAAAQSDLVKGKPGQALARIFRKRFDDLSARTYCEAAC